MAYVRLKEIAERANVSINTVSRALKDKHDIGIKTKKRIHSIAEELGYIPHATASSLRSKCNRTIGVVITHLDNAFFSSILQGINDAIVNHGFTILTLSSNEDPETEQRILRTLAANRVAGIIFVPSQDLRNVIDYDNLRAPHISIVRRGPANTLNYFITDSYRSGVIAARYFLKKDRKNPAYIGYFMPVSCNKSRFEGFRDELKENGILLKEKQICLCDSNPDEAYKTTKTIIKSVKEIDSIFVYNDQMAFGVLRALYDLGVHIPQDISVLGHDDIAEARHFIPSLSTVRVPKYKLGFESASCLVELIQEGKGVSKNVVYNPELIGRET
ncbi:MAG: LacI family DNA-binding transcriptional regulator [Spirochaetota bacterium]